MIEKSNSVGGILRPNKSANYQLDQGFWMPNYTGIKEMDDFFDKIFVKKKFNKFWYRKKDIAGSIINKKFDPNSSFPNFKTYSKKIQKSIKPRDIIPLGLRKKLYDTGLNLTLITNSFMSSSSSKVVLNLLL